MVGNEGSLMRMCGIEGNEGSLTSSMCMGTVWYVAWTWSNNGVSGEWTMELCMLGASVK